MKIFIDLGSHFGAIINKFIASPLYCEPCEIYAFEPNPEIKDSHFEKYPKNVIVHKKAAWIKNGEIEFFINKNPKFQGSSVCRNKITGFLDKKNPVKIETIDFSAWLKLNFKDTDEIILKMNIEGAEYSLLEKMIADGSINMINKLFLRRHWHKIGIDEKIDTHLMTQLSLVSGLEVFNEYDFEVKK